MHYFQTKVPKRSILYDYFREKFIIPYRLWIYRFFRRMLIIFVLALVANFFFSYFFYTPKMWQLREQNNRIVKNYEYLMARIAQANEELQHIRSRDINQYRSVFSADTLNNPALYADYPESRYEDLGFGRYATLMRDAQLSLDRLSRGVYTRSLSMDQIENLALTKDIMMEHLPTMWPLDRKRLRGNIGMFGSRNDPFNRGRRQHDGVDFSGPIGLPIYATGNGVVIMPKGEHGYGLQVMVDHKFGYRTRYAHLSEVLVKPGQWVKRGEIIAKLGNTGRSTGPHLHYEIILRGTPVNPMSYLSRDMTSDEFREIVDNARATTYEKDE